MNDESIKELRTSILKMISRLTPMKSFMREEELEDFEYYESFKITKKTKLEVCFSIIDRLTLIEARLLKRNKLIK